MAAARRAGWAVVAASLFCASLAGRAEGETGGLRATLINGTDGRPAHAEAATLFRLARGMEPLRELGSVSGELTIDGIEIDPQARYLFQLDVQGVHYNHPLELRPGVTTNLSLTVYDTTTRWDDVEIAALRITLQRDGDRLRGQELFIVENRTDPPRTLYDPEGTFSFQLPPSLLQLGTVTATSSAGMPVPQPVELGKDGSTYLSRTAFKPGTTELAVTFDLAYQEGRYRFQETTTLPLSRVILLISPDDVDLEAAGWELLDAGPSSRFVVARKNRVPAGALLDFTVSGGTAGATSMPTIAPHGTVQNLPDPTFPGKWIVVLLMSAALGYGLLTVVMGESSALE